MNNQPQPPRIYYGWVIVACSWLANFTTVSVNPVTFAFFLDPMSASLGVSRSTLVWGFTIRQITGGFFAPYLGRIVDRYGSRWAGFFAGLTIGLVLFGFALTTNIWILYALFFISGLSGFGTFGGNLLTMVPPSNWFVAKRGRAVAIASSGMLLGTASFALLAALLIETLGWRWAWGIFAIVALLGVLPAYGLFMRRKPEDMGLFPDGATSAPAPMQIDQRTRRAEPEFTVKQAMRTPVLWTSLAATTVMMLAISPFILFRNHYWGTLGFSPAVIAIGVALDPFCFAGSNMLMGFFAEKMKIRFAGVIGSVWRFFGMLPLCLGMTWPGSVVIHNVVWGIGSGTNAVFQNLMIPDYFGRKSQGAIRGAITPIMVIFSALGAPLGGYLLDAGLSYTIFFWVVTGMVVGSGGAAIFMKPPRPVVEPTSMPAMAAGRV